MLADMVSEFLFFFVFCPSIVTSPGAFHHSAGHPVGSIPSRAEINFA